MTGLEAWAMIAYAALNVHYKVKFRKNEEEGKR